MHRLRTLVAAIPLLLATACATFGGGGEPRANSKAGTVSHGELVTVPWGTVEDWNILVSPMQMGTEEPGSESDNALLRFRTFATVQDPSSWQVTALYRFAYARNDSSVHWVEGSANYLMVPR